MNETADGALRGVRRKEDKQILANWQDNRLAASSAKASVAITMFDPFLTFVGEMNLNWKQVNSVSCLKKTLFIYFFFVVLTFS